MQRFAPAVRRDLDAVTNALTEGWSNGQTEGHINRLKTLKRDVRSRRRRTLTRPDVASPLADSAPNVRQTPIRTRREGETVDARWAHRQRELQWRQLAQPWATIQGRLSLHCAERKASSEVALNKEIEDYRWNDTNQRVDRGGIEIDAAGRSRRENQSGEWRCFLRR